MLSSQARMCNAFHSFHVKISTLSTLSGKKTSNFYVNSKHVPVHRKKKRMKGRYYILRTRNTFVRISLNWPKNLFRCFKRNLMLNLCK